MRADLSPLALGRYPTPLERLDPTRLPPMGETELWVKHDDRTHDVVGGNKVRKLEWLLADARARGATHVWTVGAAGSHHVLATTYFGRREGFTVGAVLVPQPRTDHVIEVLRASIALGLEATPTSSWAAAGAAVLWRLGPGRWSKGAPRRSRFITVGGSSVLGAMAYVDAARELADQVRAGQMPEPDVCVVALGSGGTAAGLIAGFAAEGLKTEVVGVAVSEPVAILRASAAHLMRACLRRHPAGKRGETSRDALASGLTKAAGPRWSVDARFLGRGYGHATGDGESAIGIGARVGLTLDVTYTAKAFAAALAHAKAASSSRPRRVILYWHTLPSAPLASLGDGSESESELARLSGLLAPDLPASALPEAPRPRPRPTRPKGPTRPRERGGNERGGNAL